MVFNEVQGASACTCCINDTLSTRLEEYAQNVRDGSLFFKKKSAVDSSEKKRNMVQEISRRKSQRGKEIVPYSHQMEKQEKNTRYRIGRSPVDKPYNTVITRLKGYFSKKIQ